MAEILDIRILYVLQTVKDGDKKRTMFSEKADVVNKFLSQGFITLRESRTLKYYF